MKKPWFSDTDIPFAEKEPYFFDNNDLNFEWVSHIENNWNVVRDELKSLLDRAPENFTPYPKQSMVTRKDSWRTIGFKFWGFPFEENIALCPKLWELTKDIPGLTALSFNMLEGGTTITPHIGDTNAIVRCHLGVDVPAEAPACGFRVGDEIRSWEEGKFLFFNDAYEHTAWNNTNQRRYIFVIDVMRPEFTHLKDSTCSRVLGTIKQEVARGEVGWLNALFGNKVGKKILFNLFRATTRYSLMRQRRGSA